MVMVFLFLALALASATPCVDLHEGTTQTLACPAGQNVFRVNFADFGNIGGSNSTCDFTSDPKCTTAAASMAHARQLCLGKASCVLDSSNDGWGPDPCPGYPKSLAVAVSCDALPHCYAVAFNTTLGSNMVLQQAPVAAAVFGSVTGNTTTVTVTVEDGGGNTYTVPAAVAGGLWKALLRPTPAGGNYNITATAVCSTEQVSVSVVNVTFGDVWFCGGQSNMALPLQNTLTRNISIAAIQSGRYNNIRLQQLRGNMNPDLAWTSVAVAAAGDASAFLQFSGTCYYFGESLTDQLGAAAPPIGLIHTAWGGSTIQQWIKNDTLNSGVCANHSSGQGNDGGWYESRVLPYSQMTLKGWLWYQGENNMYSTFGNSLLKFGYSCLMPVLVSEWRALWSSTPGTTDPAAPFGVVTLASSGSEGGHNLGSMRLAQTAGYGVLPNPLMPNTFLVQALDLDDPWINTTCSDAKCCGYDLNLTTCARRGPNAQSLCADYCSNTWSTRWYMGPIHPRDKKPVGDRLAQSAGVAVYGKPGAFTGPTISGCTVNAASNTVTVTFNASLLGADTVQVQSYPPPFNNVSASSLAVLVDPNGFCFQGNGRQCLDDGTGTAGANETDSGWVYVDIAESTANSITVDLTRSGGAIYGIRYGMEDATCCQHYAPTSAPCPVASCPLMGRTSRLPANPFMAHIVGGKCACIPPQICDA